MALYAEAKEQYTLAPSGQFQAVCCEVLDFGFVPHEYKNKDGGVDKVVNREIRFVFQLNKIDGETNKRFEIRSRPLNLILSEKANLRAFLISWRGHDLQSHELKSPGVDLEGLIGRNAVISIIHAPVGDKTYANIGAIMPLMEGMPQMSPDGYEPKQGKIDNANAAGVFGEQSPSLSQIRANYQANDFAVPMIGQSVDIKPDPETIPF